MKNSSRRGECILVSLGCLGCLFVLVAGGIFALWLYLRPKPSDVRPLEHATPARSVEISRQQLPTATPALELPEVRLATPTPEPAPQLSAAGLHLGMTRKQVPSGVKLKLAYQDEILTEILDAPELQAGGQSFKTNETADLQQLRQALPTRRETQRSEHDGGICHTFPLDGVEVRIWIKDSRYQKFALLAR